MSVNLIDSSDITVSQTNNDIELNVNDSVVEAFTGDLTNLTTTDKSNLVSAINEVDSHSDSTASDLADEIDRAKGVEGTLSSLTTDDKTDLVSAINEVDLHSDTNATNLSNHIGNTSNPHSVTASQVGLGNVDNTSDLDKPISTATQTALDGKVSDVQVNGTSVVTNKVASISVPVTTSSVTQNSTDALTSGEIGRAHV